MGEIHQAASCTSAVTSFNAVKYIKENDRVLIIGGSGGVGSSTIKLSKLRGASYIATTSSYERDILLGLGADEVINYKEKNWWDVEEYQENKFDVIIDTVGGRNFYDKATRVLKTGKEKGTFVAVTGDDPRADISSYYKAVKFMCNMPLRYTYYIRYRKYPRYILLLPYDEVISLKEVLKLMDEGKLKILIDPSSPLPFTKEGVQEAFRIQGNGCPWKGFCESIRLNAFFGLVFCEQIKMIIFNFFWDVHVILENDYCRLKYNTIVLNQLCPFTIICKSIRL